MLPLHFNAQNSILRYFQQHPRSITARTIQPLFFRFSQLLPIHSKSGCGTFAARQQTAAIKVTVCVHTRHGKKYVEVVFFPLCTVTASITAGRIAQEEVSNWKTRWIQFIFFNTNNVPFLVYLFAVFYCDTLTRRISFNTAVLLRNNIADFTLNLTLE